ncbi:MerR family transcriptional regulator [Conexibacter sp. SYSU D00693]|uniref:MerR family transcriptional regulator n=1 Tax=Conexibacter sp. SYSU D00693 TaxID=2812560 RepID=UPI00196A7D8C|nr:MerR family transcriptional regulator [Conexibacter sp. SYSU D00693]
MAAEPEDELTIDELAQAVGMTVRNVRAHQSRGLLPPPEIRGRTGFYGPEHVSRLELVKDLQAEGFNLEAIRRILEATPGGVSPLLQFTRAVVQPFSDEEPEIREATALGERWGDQLTPELTEKLVKQGFVRPLADGRVELPSPRLNRVATELAELGVPLTAVVEVGAILRKESEAIAKAYVKVFLEHVWRPFHEAGEPAERWPEVREALERIRPLAAESVVGAFGVAMTEAVERALERELARIGGEKPRKR